MSATILRFSEDVRCAVKRVRATEKFLEEAKMVDIPMWGRELRKARDAFLKVATVEREPFLKVVTANAHPQD